MSVGRGQMANAFQLASRLVKEWVTRAKETLDQESNPSIRDDSHDPVPLVINITDGEFIDCEADAKTFLSNVSQVERFVMFLNFGS